MIKIHTNMLKIKIFNLKYSKILKMNLKKKNRVLRFLCLLTVNVLELLGIFGLNIYLFYSFDKLKILIFSVF